MKFGTYIRLLMLIGGLGFSGSAMASYVNSDGVNCRAAPNMRAHVVAKLARGQQVSTVEGGGGWTKVARPSCWVSSQFLSADHVARTNTREYDDLRSNAWRSYRKQSSGNLYSVNAPATRKRKSSASRSRKRNSDSGLNGGSGCPCSGGTVCIGPRGGRYCITSGGNKRYGV